MGANLVFVTLWQVEIQNGLKSLQMPTTYYFLVQDINRFLKSLVELGPEQSHPIISERKKLKLTLRVVTCPGLHGSS